ncbi:MULTISPECIES: BspA family leucine-rich repeat surface protein [Flavobacteriaceae]|uniref:BspA family leucine-rich repeat surface protein n=1 Tax=Flavobacteriaceae TaxID=49546 RepID=UPI0014926E6F|nr:MULTISPECIES: BspA family leucine-rich repeat surface protein [Allomuricauda]MDC6364968.1 BspA family leucine-rich repeat surface protein [Muricauda sp. AC10]
MKFKNALLTTLTAIVLFSCGKDDGPQNNTPKINGPFTFTVKENVSDNATFGTVLASDADGDELEFAIVTNDNNLFEIVKTSGAISLALGKSLDFETSSSHSISISVSDGIVSATASITINVEDVDEILEGNNAPEISPQDFEVSENIQDTDVIGTISASDEDQDPLHFEITSDASGLFEVDESNGDLSLVEGKSLDFETAESYTITVSVTDGMDTETAQITIDVTDVLEPGDLSLSSDSFITAWTIQDPVPVIIYLDQDYEYNFNVDWGDGIVETITGGQSFEHTYLSEGIYEVSMKGQMPRITIAATTSLTSIEQWGTNPWVQLSFIQCFNMVSNATDVPNLSQTISMQGMFQSCHAFNGDVSDWDVSNVTNMEAMFFQASTFNGDLTNWDVSNVANMQLMFFEASAFEGQGISEWEVNQVTTMTGMFENATSFDQNLGLWDITNKPSMNLLFSNSGLSPENYGNTLEGWFNQENTPEGVTLGANGLIVCGDNPAQAEARVNLEGQLSWNIIGDSIEFCN